MDASSRRKKTAEIIRTSDAPVTGGELSSRLGVSRQVVVQDIALLRAAGLPVIATPSGYTMIASSAKTRPMKIFTCCHETLEQAETELRIMVENGGKVRNVIIEHPVYGKLSGSLMVSTAADIEHLMERLKKKDALMLAAVTGGIHMHTVEAADDEALSRIEEQLRDAGILRQEVHPAAD